MKYTIYRSKELQKEVLRQWIEIQNSLISKESKLYELVRDMIDSIGCTNAIPDYWFYLRKIGNDKTKNIKDVRLFSWAWTVAELYTFDMSEELHKRFCDVLINEYERDQSQWIITNQFKEKGM